MDTTDSISLLELEKRIVLLHEWLVEKDFKFYSLNYTPQPNFLKLIINQSKTLGILWRQLFRISPINFRSILGLSPEIVDPQATIILATAYLNLMKLFPEESYNIMFEKCIDRVISFRSPKAKFFAISQGKRIQLKYYSAEPDDIAPLLTVWAGRLFIEAYEYSKDEKYLNLAIEVKDYFSREHPKEYIEDKVYFYYSSRSNFKVWNASCEISSFLMQIGRKSSDNNAYFLGEKGMELIIEKQNLSGSWFYGETKIMRYIDNFHTAFILRAINSSLEYSDSEKLLNSFRKGMAFYIKEFFIKKSNGQIQPRHFIKNYFPLNSNALQMTDIRDCALSIILLSEISTQFMSYNEFVKGIISWVNSNMSEMKTYYAEKTWLWNNEIPYIDFQAWMLLALIQCFRLESNK